MIFYVCSKSPYFGSRKILHFPLFCRGQRAGVPERGTGKWKTQTMESLTEDDIWTEIIVEPDTYRRTHSHRERRGREGIRQSSWAADNHGWTAITCRYDVTI